MKGKFFQNLSQGYANKIWLLLFLMVAFLAGALALWLLPSLNRVEKDVSVLELEIAGKANELVDNFISYQIQTLENQTIWLGINPEKHREILERILRENETFEEISFLGITGKEISRTSRLKVFTPADLRDKSATKGFQQAVVLEKSYISSVFSSENSEPLTTITMPVFFSKKLVGVLSANLNLKYIWKIISQTKFGKTGLVYIVDREGKLIAHPDRSLVLRGTTFIEREIVKEVAVRGNIVDGLNKKDRYLNEKGKAVQAAGKPIPALNWGVIAEQESQEILVPRNQLILLALTIGVVGVVLISLLVLIMANLVRTEKKLREAKVALEEINVSLEAKIEARTRELEDLTENLENQVQKRTEDLQIKTKDLQLSTENLQTKIRELEKFQKLTVGRELKMTELKEKIQKLEKGQIMS